MHIIAPIKQVPESEELRYDPATRTLAREGVATAINTFDKRALTEAIRLRSLHGGSITAITMGPPQARDALIECLGRGVDRAIHVSDRAFAGSDTLATARTLAAAIRRLSFDLLLLGKWSTDAETGQVGPELAELLDLPHVTGATAITVTRDGKLLVTRETDYGFEEIECPLPALLTAAERLIKPTKTKPPVIEEGQRRLAADPTLIETLNAHDLGIPPQEAGLSGSPTWVADLRPVVVNRERTKLSGDTRSTAESLLLALRTRGLASLGSRADIALPPPQPPANPDHARTIWAVAEWLPNDDPGPELRRISLELTSEAARLATLTDGHAVSVLLGYGVEPLAGQLAAYGASRVLLADSPALALYAAETYTWVLSRAIEKYQPWAVLLPATSFGRDLAPRVAARLGLGLTGDCTGLELDAESHLLQIKPAFGGQVVAPILSRTLPQMATIRPGMLETYAPDPLRKPEIERLGLEGLPESRARVTKVTHEGEAGLALDYARLVVCVGTGIGGPESLPEIYEFASAVGEWMGLSPAEVAVGGSRKVVDEGWLPRHQQIGITGRAVAPDLYVGLGISGTFNHTVGILRSGTIISVNTDPDAPIFASSDIGVVSDWRQFANEVISICKSF
ncbi:MAG TPA: FAD-binding protein [Chloroflexia bacterium]|nr:FAD-binding protein [Chloroflexia bacterium]